MIILNSMIRQGSTVEWTKGDQRMHGKVVETFDHAFVHFFAGQIMIRKGNTGNKVLLIETNDEIEIVKMENDVENMNT